VSAARENILGRVRSALGRANGAPPDDLPPPRLAAAAPASAEDRIARFRAALETLAAKVAVVHSKADAGGYVRSVVGDHPVVCTASALLAECGISFPQSSVDKAQVGVTTAEYALADTGTLVVMSAAEPRLLSLLPPVHIAVIESSRILGSLDELFTLMPMPADGSASTVFITGPSRTADIEQILVRGVHGPGELHVVIIE
jgi:L-lactate dehydrogenase complex protein LldG